MVDQIPMAGLCFDVLTAYQVVTSFLPAMGFFQ